MQLRLQAHGTGEQPMNNLSCGETALLIVLIWTTWIIFYWAGKNNLLGYMSDTISDFGKQLSESMRKTEGVKITKNEKDGLIELLCTAGWNLFTDNNAINQVADHLIAHNVTIPPVSVGQTVYIIRRPTEHPAWIYECEITYISAHYFKDGKSTVFSGYNFEVAECDIGKTVFLAREEAEQALKERSEKE